MWLSGLIRPHVLSILSLGAKPLRIRHMWPFSRKRRNMYGKYYMVGGTFDDIQPSPD